MVTTLRERRIEECDKFAKKCMGNTRFSSWFPTKMGRASSRRGEKYLEEFARCDRLRNTPLFLHEEETERIGGFTGGQTVTDWWHEEHSRRQGSIESEVRLPGR